MTSHQISTASTSVLEAREAHLRARSTGLASFDEGFDDIWSEIDEIRDELVGRAHAAEDPSAGAAFGHFPT